MITKIKIENYRSYKEAEFNLKPLTLLIGPVAGGKSNFIKALILLQNSILYPPQALFPAGYGEFRLVRNRLAKPTDPVGFEVEVDEVEGFPNEKARYILQLADGPEGVYVFREELIKISPDKPETWVFKRDMQGGSLGVLGPFVHSDPTMLREVLRKKRPNWQGGLGAYLEKEMSPEKNEKSPRYLDIEGDEDLRFIVRFAESIFRSDYFHLDVECLKSPGEGNGSAYISSQGKRLPDFLARLRQEQPGIFNKLTDGLKEVIDNFEDLIIAPIEPGRQDIQILFKNHKLAIPAQDLSDGTMLALGILSIVHRPDPAGILLIEEPETGLHPRIMRWLFDRLISLSYPIENGKKIQVIVSSHSPFFLDLFAEMEDSVLVVEQKGGNTKVTPLPKILEILQTSEDSPPLGYEWASGLFEGLR